MLGVNGLDIPAFIRCDLRLFLLNVAILCLVKGVRVLYVLT